MYAADCLLAARGIDDPSDEAFTGALLEAEHYHLIRSFLTSQAPSPRPHAPRRRGR